MKILNVLITLLVISILISGGFLGYLLYVQNTEQGVNNNGNVINNNNNNTTGTPNDNNVTADTGCSNLFVQGNGNANQLANLQLDIKSSSNGDLSVGDKVTLTTSVISSDPAKSWKGLELRIIFPCENMKFLNSTPSGGDNFAIPVDSEYDNIVEVHLATTKDSFSSGDQLVQLEFEVTKLGASIIEVADNSSLIDDQSVSYSIPTNKVNL